MQYTFVVDGQPHAKHRPRFSRFSNHVFTEKSDHDYEALVMLSFLEKYPQAEPIDTAVSVVIRAFFSIPKGTTKNRRQLMESGAILHTVKPDADNVIKSVLDGLNGIAWRDDKQVTDLMIQKRYGNKPRIEVIITGVNDE